MYKALGSFLKVLKGEQSSFIHSFHKLSPSTFYAPGTMLGARCTQIKSGPVLKGLPPLVGEAGIRFVTELCLRDPVLII